MSDCKCESVKIYDGEHRCMKCYRRFAPIPPKPRYFIDPNAECSMAALARNEQAVMPMTRRSDNLPLGVDPK